jgi:uncharacterized protein with FMN-binding domain
MRRAPIVMAATAAGLVGVLSFHSKAARPTLGGLPSATATTHSPTASGPATSAPAPGATSTSPPPPVTTPPTAPSTTPTTNPSATRTTTGPLVNYNYGVMSVAVTVAGGRITKVGIGSLDDGGNFRSQSIDQQSIPTLEQEALQAQSANIQGVSGASYTSAGFEQSLQGALGKLGVT